MNLEVLVDVTSDRFVEKEGARDLWIVTCVLCRDGELEVRRARIELPDGARTGPVVEEDLGELCRGHRLRVRKRRLDLPATFTRRTDRLVIRTACEEDLGDCPALLPWGPGTGPSRPRSVSRPGPTRRGLVFPALTDLVATVEPCPCDEDSARWGVRYRERTLSGPGVRLRKETVRVDPSCFCCLPLEAAGTPYPYPYPYPTPGRCSEGFVETSCCDCLPRTLTVTFTMRAPEGRDCATFDAEVDFVEGESTADRQVWEGRDLGFPCATSPATFDLRLTCDGTALVTGCRRFFLQIDLGDKQPVVECCCDPFHLRWKVVKGVKDLGCCLTTPGFLQVEITAAESQALDPVDEGDVRSMLRWLEGPPRSWPRGWHTWPVTREAHRVLAERFLERVDGAMPKGSGRGIVTTGGGRYFRPAYVLLRLLRELGCGLPVEVWHLGPEEMGEERRAVLADLGARTVDAEEVRRNHPARILTGWPLKPFSILHSSFREVLWLDADNMPLRDPEYLFDSSPFREVGTLAWPDLNHHRLDPDRQIWEVVGVPHRDEWEWESGQLLIDRARCARALRLTVHYNEHSDFYYHHVYGDKDTFHLAWIRTGTPYVYPARPTRPSSWGLLQYCPVTERPLFQHLAGPGKWGFYEGARRRDVIRYGDRLERFLEELST